MHIYPKPAEVTITFSPNDYWIKESDDPLKGDFMLVVQIDMSYKGKDNQEGCPVLYLNEREVDIFRKAGFGELVS